MADEPVVVLVRMAQENAGLDLAADAALRSERATGPNQRRINHRALADIARTGDDTAGANLDPLVNQDSAQPQVKDHARVNSRAGGNLPDCAGCR